MGVLLLYKYKVNYMLLNLIIALQLHIIFSANPVVDCYTGANSTVVEQGYKLGGCQSGNNIIIGFDGDSDKILYHELGHRLFTFNEDTEVLDLISKYPAPRVYSDISYPTAELKLNEKVADYFQMKMSYSDFPKKFPEINKLFNERLAIYK